MSERGVLTLLLVTLASVNAGLSLASVVEGQAVSAGVLGGLAVLCALVALLPLTGDAP